TTTRSSISAKPSAYGAECGTESVQYPRDLRLRCRRVPSSLVSERLPQAGGWGLAGTIPEHDSLQRPGATDALLRGIGTAAGRQLELLSCCRRSARREPLSLL